MMTPERILVARAKMAAGDFERAIKSRVPLEVMTDELRLECGHTTWAFPLSKDEVDTGKRYCSDCAAAWVCGDGAGAGQP